MGGEQRHHQAHGGRLLDHGRVEQWGTGALGFLVKEAVRGGDDFWRLGFLGQGGGNFFLRLGVGFVDWIW